MRTAALNVEGSRKVVMVMFGYVISQRAEHQNITWALCWKNKERCVREIFIFEFIFIV